MKNVNRDYLVTVDAKTADIKSTPSNMQFYVTDINTSNIFFELIFNESTNSLVNRYTENERANDYNLTLRVLKPDGTPKEIEATQLNDSNFFVADLTGDFTDFIGIYQCELFIEADTTNEYGYLQQERNTTDPFEYEVVKSIFSDLGEVIEGDPDYPTLIDTLATRDYVNAAIENIYLGDYATKIYVNEAIANINSVDYATRNYVDRAIENININNYATKKHVNEVIASINLTNYATKDYVNEAISNIKLSDDLSLDSIATKEYVKQEILNAQLGDGVDTSYLATKEYVNERLGDIDSILDYLNGEVI